MSPRPATYLDSNAGAPLQPGVVETLGEALRAFPFGNPSSSHSYGREARRILSKARRNVAVSLGAQVDRVVFTSSGTEAVQTVLRSALKAGDHWITSAVDHEATLAFAEDWKSRGEQVTILPVSRTGLIDPKRLVEAWRPSTRLFSTLWVNNETGVIADIATLSAETRRLGGVLHLDAAQAWGKLPIDIERTGAHYLSVSGAKIGATAGTGAIACASDAPALRPWLLGKQERNLRGGTENLLGALAMGAASSALNPQAWISATEPSRDHLETRVLERIPGATVYGKGAPRVANTVSFGFEQVEEEGLVAALDLAGFAVSSGAACSSGLPEPSHVLLAMGYSEGQARGPIRVSLPGPLPPETIEAFVQSLEKAVSRQRA